MYQKYQGSQAKQISIRICPVKKPCLAIKHHIDPPRFLKNHQNNIRVPIPWQFFTSRNPRYMFNPCYMFLATFFLRPRPTIAPNNFQNFARVSDSHVSGFPHIFRKTMNQTRFINIIISEQMCHTRMLRTKIPESF